MFEVNDSRRLFLLSKKLHASKFFEIFLNDSQSKLFNYLMGLDNLTVWEQFLEGNVVLTIDRTQSTENASSEDQAENGAEYEAFEEGSRAIKLLALHIRYLLWEKAIDFYYTVKEVDSSTTDIQEVWDEYELIDLLEAEETEETLKDNAGQKALEKPVVREEEDDYDDDDDDEVAEKAPETDPFSTAEVFEYNDEKKLILQVPMSIFETKEASPEAETTEPAASSVSSPSASKAETLEPTETDANDSSLEDQEKIIKEFNKVYHNFEYDRETLLKRRKLEKSDMQLEESAETDEKDPAIDEAATSAEAASANANMGINLGSATTSLKHLLKAIQHKRDDIPLNDHELRTLFMDVRKNRGKWANDERVGQEELYEAFEKVLTDLRGYTEHSTPFLNKVSKREAPNYGLIIKKPMDLNTIMKKLKNLNYQSKQQFVDDLMLIWSNCLTYNADPKHFLRAHALAMQKKTLKLIPTIPNMTIRSRAELDKEEAELESVANATNISDANTTDNATPGKTGAVSSYGPGSGTAKTTAKKGRKRTREDQIKVEEEVESLDELAEQSPRISATPAIENGNLSVEEPQIESSTNTAAVAPTNEVVGAVADDEEEEEYENLEMNGSEEDDEVDPELQAWRSLTAKSRANYCATRSKLFISGTKLNSEAEAIIREPNEMNNFNEFLNNKLVVSKNNNYLENDEPYLLEYDITGGLPGIKYRGLGEQEEEKREQKLVDAYLALNNDDPSPFVLPVTSGLNMIYTQNIHEIQEIRKICFKISLIRQMQTQQFVHHTQMKQPEIEVLKEVDVDPVSRLANHDPYNDKVQYSVLRRNVAKIAMQTGYESTEPFAINTLAQVAETYLGNLAKSIKVHTESNSANKEKRPLHEILLLSLLENGIDKPDDLYTFVQERVMKQRTKLKDLRVKLSNFLRELLRPNLENFNEKSFDDNSEQFMTGDFTNDLGDDFFGFKELGLDKEFKMLSSSIPIYLLHSRLNNSYNNTGLINKKNKYEDLTGWEPHKLREVDVSKQVKILQPFYTKLLEKSKTHFVKMQKKKGESADLPSPEDMLLIEDEELPQKQRNIRPRLPPTGKITSVKKKVVSSSFYLSETSQPEPLQKSDMPYENDDEAETPLQHFQTSPIKLES